MSIPADFLSLKHEQQIQILLQLSPFEVGRLSQVSHNYKNLIKNSWVEIDTEQNRLFVAKHLLNKTNFSQKIRQIFETVKRNSQPQDQQNPHVKILPINGNAEMTDGEMSQLNERLAAVKERFERISRNLIKLTEEKFFTPEELTDLENKILKIYADTYSLEELVTLAKWYSDPVKRSVLEKMPSYTNAFNAIIKLKLKSLNNKSMIEIMKNPQLLTQEYTQQNIQPPPSYDSGYDGDVDSMKGSDDEGLNDNWWRKK